MSRLPAGACELGAPPEMVSLVVVYGINGRECAGVCPGAHFHLAGARVGESDVQVDEAVFGQGGV